MALLSCVVWGRKGKVTARVPSMPVKVLLFVDSIQYRLILLLTLTLRLVRSATQGPATGLRGVQGPAGQAASDIPGLGETHRAAFDGRVVRACLSSQRWT